MALENPASTSSFKQPAIAGGNHPSMVGIFKPAVFHGTTAPQPPW